LSRGRADTNMSTPQVSILMTQIQRVLARNIKKARGRLGLSQMKLAESSGISTSYLGEIEICKKYPSADTLERISTALGMKPYQLFLEEEDWQVFDKEETITNLYRELKERINSELDDAYKKHLW
jgi:transcriptional regulator with XRE-family HTH domain